MKVLGIMLLCGIAFASTSMASIEHSDFGHALSDAIQLQLKLEGGVDLVIGMIADLKDDVQAEQDQHDADLAAKQDECDAALTLYQSRIDQANADIDQATSDLATWRPELAQAEADLAENQANLASTEQEKAQAESDRVVAIEEYKVRVAENEAAIKACDDAVTLVKDYYAGSALEGTFLQKRSVLVQVTSHVQAVRRVAPSFAPILKTLVQLSAAPQADSDKIVKVVNLIEDLRAKLVDSLNGEHEAEAKAKADYEALIAALTATIADLKATINGLEMKIEDLEAKIADGEDRLADGEARLELNTTLYNDKDEECEAYYADHVAQTARRADEMDTCQEAVDLLEERFADKSDYVMSKVENVE